MDQWYPRFPTTNAEELKKGKPQLELVLRHRVLSPSRRYLVIDRIGCQTFYGSEEDAATVVLKLLARYKREGRYVN